MAELTDSQQEGAANLQMPQRLRKVPPVRQGQGQPDAGADGGANAHEGAGEAGGFRADVSRTGAPKAGAPRADAVDATQADASRATTPRTGMARTGIPGEDVVEAAGPKGEPAAAPAASRRPARGMKPDEAAKAPQDAAYGSNEAGEGESEQDDAPSARTRRAGARKSRFGIWRAVAVVVAAVLVVLLVLLGLFSWNRWLRFDDAADFQGEWYAAGTAVAITVDADEIRFDDKTAYAYELDPSTKTVRYSLGSLAGEGHYWFSSDRDSLVITDGEGFTRWGTALADLGFDISNFANALTGGEFKLPAGLDVISLSREPNAPAESGGQGADAGQGGQSQAAPASGDSAGSAAAEPAEEAASSDAAASADASSKGMFDRVNDQTYIPEGAEGAAGQQDALPAAGGESPPEGEPAAEAPPEGEAQATG